MAEENKEQNPETALDLSGLGSFDFTPAWAKGKPDDKAKFARFEEREERREARGPRRDGDRPRFDAPRRDGDRPPRRDDRGPRREGGDRPHFGGPRRDERPMREFIKPLDADVRILPAQKDIGTIINKIKTSHLAYPLKQLAYFFLDHPEACVLRISPKKDSAEPISFHQCKACGFVAFSEDELMAHVVSAHLGDYYDAEELECEAPKGAFNCVAKCGLTGELLGPPNLHGYDARVREMVRTRFPNMSEEAYRARIEMVRDSEVVEQWRATATKKTVFKKKGEENAPAVEREAAELEFRRTIAPGLMTAPKSVDMTADVALKSPSKPLLFACRDALQREKRFPASLFFALRGAFHHRKLAFFRANDPRGPEFVSAAKPVALDTAHAIADLVELVKYVEAHAGTTQQRLVAELGAGDATKSANVSAHLSWLIEKGHLVGYANGVLSLPDEHPRYRPPAQNRKAASSEEKKEPTPASAADPVPAAETIPVPETAPVLEDAPVPEEKKEEVTKDETADQLAE